MELGQVEQHLGISADVRDGMLSPLGSLAHNERVIHGTFRACVPAIWSNTERDIKKLCSVAVCVSSACGAIAW